MFGTTICAVRRNDNDVCIGADGQLTNGNIIVQTDSNKVWKTKSRKVLYGISGKLDSSMTMRELFESEMDSEMNGEGDSLYSTLESLSKKMRHHELDILEDVLLIAVDCNGIGLLSGTGEVILPKSNYAAVGSGGNYAYAAARALYENTDINAKAVVQKSLEIASDICVYTNKNRTILSL